MNILLKQDFNQNIHGTIKKPKHLYFRRKMETNEYNNDLNNKDNNSIESISNKKELEHNNLTKSKNFGYYSQKTEYSSKLSDNNIIKNRKRGESKKIFMDIKVNKTIQPNYKNRNIFKKKHLPNKTLNNYYSINTFPNINRNKEYYKDIHKFEIDKVITFTSNLFYSKTPNKKVGVQENQINSDIKKIRKNKFNSINCFIDDYTIKDDNEYKRYKTNFRNYFGDSDYERLKEKEKNYLTEMKKIKLIYKNTNLMNALFDYLNLAFGKLKNEKNENIKTIKKAQKEIRIKNKYMKFLQNNSKHNLIPLKDLFNNNTKKNNLKSAFKGRNKNHLKKELFSFYKDYLYNKK